MMHGGVTAIAGILTQSYREGRKLPLGVALLPGFLAAVICHSLFNHFLLDPRLMTALILVVFPLLIVIVFKESERRTRHWLGIGFDSDQALLVGEGGGAGALAGSGVPERWENTSVTIVEACTPWRVQLLNCCVHLEDLPAVDSPGGLA